MMAKSAEAFLRAHPVAWAGGLYQLKVEVDRLVHIDLNLASGLVDRIERLAAVTLIRAPRHSRGPAAAACFTFAANTAKPIRSTILPQRLCAISI
jgi:hypothetical protein